MDSHVPILEALSLTRRAMANLHYRDLIAKAEQSVKRGEPISNAFEDTDMVAPVVCQTISSGEKSGQVGPLLQNLADFLDEENEVILRSLVSIIEPVILIIMGVVVGFVALSMFMPLFDLTAATGG